MTEKQSLAFIVTLNNLVAMALFVILRIFLGLWVVLNLMNINFK